MEYEIPRLADTVRLNAPDSTLNTSVVAPADVHADDVLPAGPRQRLDHQSHRAAWA